MRPVRSSTTPLDVIGAGHAHLFVLERLAHHPGLVDPECLRVIAPSPYQYYSGMLPGLIAGHFTPEQCRLPVKAWAIAAGAQWIEASLITLDTNERSMQLSDGQRLPVEQVSLATGLVCDLAPFRSYQGKLLSVKPMETFYDQWLKLQQSRPQSLAVVGGGAGGFELICAIAECWQSLDWRGKLYWVIGEGQMLATFPKAVSRFASVALQRYGIKTLLGRASGYEAGLNLSYGCQLPVDAVVLATGGTAPDWVKASGLTTVDGCVEVDAYHRSVSHPFVFAAGDLCARPNTALKASGVYAVRAGPILAKNVLQSLNPAACADTHPRLIPYHPQSRVLSLLSCGRQQAIAQYGFFVTQGHWVWLCKRAIDAAFIKRFQLTSQ